MKYGLYYLGAVVSFLLVLITAASGDYILAAVFGALFVCCGVEYIT